MLRFTKQNRTHISNRLAIFAGLMLVISVLAGMDDTEKAKLESSGQFAGLETPEIEQPISANQRGNHLNKSKGFKVSLFLFRFN